MPWVYFKRRRPGTPWEPIGSHDAREQVRLLDSVPSAGKMLEGFAIAAVQCPRPKAPATLTMSAAEFTIGDQTYKVDNVEIYKATVLDEVTCADVAKLAADVGKSASLGAAAEFCPGSYPPGTRYLARGPDGQWREINSFRAGLLKSAYAGTGTFCEGSALAICLPAPTEGSSPDAKA